MKIKASLKALVAGVIGAVVLGAAAQAEEKRLRISLDTGPGASRVEWVMKFADAVNARAEGRLKAEVYHSGQLFRDSDVIRAIRQGNIEMGVPGTWQLGGLDPRMNITQMPVMYGRTEGEVAAVLRGPVGQGLSADLAAQLSVHILGDWLDMDSGSVFTTKKQIQTRADYEGLTLRFPGAAAIEERLRLLKASPIHVPFPDVPLGLQRGNFDGLISTANSIISAKLWESGIKYAYLEANSRDKFIPIVSGKFWQGLDPDLQTILTEEWASMIEPARVDIAARSAREEAYLEEQGVVLTRPSVQELAETRKILMAHQDSLAKQLAIPAEFLAQVVAQFPAEAN